MVVCICKCAQFLGFRTSGPADKLNHIRSREGVRTTTKVGSATISKSAYRGVDSNGGANRPMLHRPDPLLHISMWYANFGLLPFGWIFLKELFVDTDRYISRSLLLCDRTVPYDRWSDFVSPVHDDPLTILIEV